MFRSGQLNALVVTDELSLAALGALEDGGSPHSSDVEEPLESDLGG